LAIRELDKIEFPVIDRIALYQRFVVDLGLLVPLYATLCSRDEPPDEVESEILGIKTTVLVFRARERLRAQPSDGGKSPLPPGIEREDVYKIILGMVDGDSTASTPREVKYCQ